MQRILPKIGTDDASSLKIEIRQTAFKKLRSNRIRKTISTDFNSNSGKVEGKLWHYSSKASTGETEYQFSEYIAIQVLTDSLKL